MAQVTVQIADKATLDTVNTNTASTKTTVESTATDVTTLKGRGGIKYNSTTSKPQVYDTTNSTWVDLEVGGGGGGNPTLTIQNENMQMTGYSITVSHESGLFTTTETMPNKASLSIEVPYLGLYTVQYPNQAGAVKTVPVEVVGLGNTVIIPTTAVSPFATASWSEIESMCNAYYDGTISDLSQYWSIGDIKEVTLSTMSATGVGETHAEQTVQFAIIDFAHDNLTTSISGKTKAAITIQQVDNLKENGYMNSTNTNTTGWTNSARRTWCNNVYYTALPSDMRSAIKSVNKLTSAGNQSATINTDSDKCWLPSEIEITGSYTNSKSGEGSQYPYYQTTANRIKKTNGSAYYWWLRSPRGSGSTTFVNVISDGSVLNGSASSTNGLAPALCI